VSQGAIPWDEWKKTLPVLVYPEYRVRLVRVPTGEQTAAVSPDAGRTKLGGMPKWIQNEETPDCPGCSRPMDFVAQIDSIDGINGTDGPFMFGDCGLIYVFYCHDCNEASTVVQFH
jgi:hypothetical protein